MKHLLQFPAELISYKTYATKRNVSCTFELQEELAPEQVAQLLSAHGQTGWLVFNPNETRLVETDIPVEPVHETEQKTKSQRLRSVLHVRWKRLQEPRPLFSMFYDVEMERIINREKEQLPPL